MCSETKVETLTVLPNVVPLAVKAWDDYKMKTYIWNMHWGTLPTGPMQKMIYFSEGCVGHLTRGSWSTGNNTSSTNSIIVAESGN